MLNQFSKPLMAFLTVLGGLFLIKRQISLEVNKLKTDEELQQAKQVINVQNKVIKAKGNIKSTNLSGILERLRKGEL